MEGGSGRYRMESLSPGARQTLTYWFLNICHLGQDIVPPRVSSIRITVPSDRVVGRVK